MAAKWRGKREIPEGYGFTDSALTDAVLLPLVPIKPNLFGEPFIP